MTLKDRSAVMNQNIVADDFEDSVEAYADGVICCASCGRVGKRNDFDNCAWGGCPMFEAEK